MSLNMFEEYEEMENHSTGSSVANLSSQIFKFINNNLCCFCCSNQSCSVVDDCNIVDNIANGTIFKEYHYA